MREVSESEIDALRAWVDRGAKWPDSAAKPGLWSLQPIAHPAPPAVSHRDWPANAIDQFINILPAHQLVPLAQVLGWSDTMLLPIPPP